MLDFFAPESRDFVAKVVMAAVRGPSARWEGELRMRRFDNGAITPVYYKLFVVCDEDGQNIGLGAITRDISAQKKAEDELRRIAADLAEADRRKSEFLATLAHELRNPLAPIRTGLDLMRVATQDPQARAKVHDMMDRQLGHLIRLVNDLLDVARITRGKIDLKKQETDAAHVVAMALETSMTHVEAGRHQLVVDAADEPLPLEIDVTRIVQVLSNLLNNAAKYTPPGGRITLTVRRDGVQALLAVADSGVGIPPDDMATLFDMFTQVGRNMDRSQGGLGIGLSLVRRLVELHGGTVSAASPGRDQGSTFEVRLPLRGQGGAPAQPDEPGLSGAPSMRILVVDDNVDAAESLAALLGVLGHTTHVAYDAIHGLALACEHEPQLAFLDIGLPGMNGHQLARAIRDTPAIGGMLLVALTGWGGREDVAESERAGFDRHLTKPVDFAALDAVFASVARGRG